MQYQTSDGKTFYTRDAAQSHANNLSSETAALNAAIRARAEEQYKNYKQIENAFNNGVWKEVIKLVAEAREKYKFDTYPFNSRYPHTGMMVSIAQANIDGDYMLAFRSGDWGNPYSGDTYPTSRETWDFLYRVAMETGKKLYELKNGKTITDTEIKNFEASVIETKIAENVKKWGHSWDTDIFKWEKATGRLMTEEDQKRITGKRFKIKLGARGSPDTNYTLKQIHSLSSSSTSSSRSSSFGKIIKTIIIIAVILFVFFKGCLS